MNAANDSLIANSSSLLLDELNQEVMIVDDDLIILEELWETCTSENYTTNIANCPRQAIERILDNPRISIVVTDLTMPLMSGLEMIRELKLRCGKDRDFHFIILTGNASIEAGIEAIQLGVHEFLEKPISADRMIDAITSAFELVRTTRLQKRSIQSILDMEDLEISQISEVLDLNPTSNAAQSKAQRDMLTMLSDEIRGPLSTIIMLADGIRDERAGHDGDLIHQYSEMIIEQGKDTLRKFDLMSSIATRLDTSTASEPTPIRRLIDEAIETQSDALSNIPIRRIGDTAAQSLSTSCNRHALRQALALLFQHIGQRHEHGERIWIGQTDQKESIQVTILIASSHASPSEIPNLINRVETLSIQHQYAPLEGIELSCAKILLKLHGGNIEIHQAPRLGNLITIDIPKQSNLVVA